MGPRDWIDQNLFTPYLLHELRTSGQVVKMNVFYKRTIGTHCKNNTLTSCCYISELAPTATHCNRPLPMCVSSKADRIR